VVAPPPARPTDDFLERREFAAEGQSSGRRRATKRSRGGSDLSTTRQETGLGARSATCFVVLGAGRQSHRHDDTAGRARRPRTRHPTRQRPRAMQSAQASVTSGPGPANHRPDQRASPGHPQARQQTPSDHAWEDAADPKTAASKLLDMSGMINTHTFTTEREIGSFRSRRERSSTVSRRARCHSTCTADGSSSSWDGPNRAAPQRDHQLLTGGR